ncbi:MAG: hypothetical protein ACRENS_02315 [Candidatus Eiseniibacteriota bacterium]
MLTRFLLALAITLLACGNAWAGRACPSDVATGASAGCDKPAHAAHAAASAHVSDATIAIPAISPAPVAAPARGTSAPGCCSMPFSSAGDVVSASSVPAAAHAAPSEAAALPHATRSTPAKPAARQPQRSAVAPAFGPLFLAHQALML